MNKALAYIQKLRKGEFDDTLLQLPPDKTLAYVIDTAFVPVGCDPDTRTAIGLLVDLVAQQARFELEERIEQLEDEATCRMLTEAT